MSQDENSEQVSLNTGELLFWVTELQSGRPDSARRTFDKILVRVEKLARNMFRKYPRVGRFVDLEDVIQSAMIRLLRALQTIRPESTRHFYALSSEMIRRELLDLIKHYYSQRGPGDRLTELSVGDSPGEFSVLSDESQESLEQWSEFHRVVEQLPVEEREVFSLVYYHGWTTESISNTFGVSVRTIQRWLSNSMQLLQHRLPPELEI